MLLKLVQPSNNEHIFSTLEVFHLEISGKDAKFGHENIHIIELIFEVSQLEISGKDFSDVHSANIPSIILALEIFHF